MGLMERNEEHKPREFVLVTFEPEGVNTASKTDSKKATSKPATATTQRRRRVAKLAQGASPGKECIRMLSPGGATPCRIRASKTSSMWYSAPRSAAKPFPLK